MKKLVKSLMFASCTGSILYSAGIAAFKMASGKSHFSKSKVSQGFKEAVAPYKNMVDEGHDWYESQTKEEIVINAIDGIKLYGSWINNPAARAVIILMHGYRSSIVDFNCIFRFYYELGFSILTISQRTSGKSEGKYIGFGAIERWDCIEWIKYVQSRLPEMPILLGGISMGASTVLMASGLGLPDQVKGIIADCGFTSAYEEIKYVVKYSTGLSIKPLFGFMESAAKHIGGFSYMTDTRKALARNTKPVFFVHGDKDSYVPLSCTLDNFIACHSYKELLVVHGAEHGMSYIVDGKRYREKIAHFVDYCLN